MERTGASQDAIGLVETIYYSSPTEQPYSIVTNGRWPIEKPEQIYHRIIPVGKEPVPIDTGWITDIGLLVIRPKALESLERGDKPILGIYLCGNLSLALRNGESLRCLPLGSVMVATLIDEMVSVEIWAFPK